MTTKQETTCRYWLLTTSDYVAGKRHPAARRLALDHAAAHVGAMVRIIGEWRLDHEATGDDLCNKLSPTPQGAEVIVRVLDERDPWGRGVLVEPIKGDRNCDLESLGCRLAVEGVDPEQNFGPGAYAAHGEVYRLSVR